MTPRRHGGVALILALSLLVLLGFAALTIDLGYARMVQAQLQAAADAAATAGAQRLTTESSGLVNARNAAVAIGAANQANGEPVLLNENISNSSEGDVVLGIWDSAAGTFTPSMDPALVNAVQVTARNDDLLPLFSRVSFGRTDLGAAARSIAVRRWLGAGGVPWYLPFGIPLCVFEELPRATIQDMDFLLNPAGIDNTGWVRVGGSPSSAWLKNYLTAMVPCMIEYATTGTVTSDCGSSASVGDSGGMQNGEDQAGLKELDRTIENYGLPWDAETWGTLPSQHPKSDIAPAKYGNMLLGPVPILQTGPEYCDAGGGAWNGNAPIVGFAMASLYDVRWNVKASERNVWLRLDIESYYTMGDWWGGSGDYGIYAAGPAELVR